MKVSVVAVGRPRKLFAAPIAEYEKRIARYFSFEAIEVKEESARGGVSSAQVCREEGKRLIARVPDATEVIALDVDGERWSSEELARFLGQLSLDGSPGTTFVIGGAYGLSDEVRDRARRRLSLSTFTFPHELARLMLVEQLYRAGTILRKEPYHKG